MKVFMLAAAICIGAACADTGTGNRSANLAASTPPAAPNGAVQATPRPEDGAPRISLADAKKDFDAHAAVFIDTRASEQFAQGHIPGAVNLSYTDIMAGKDDKLPKGKKIIAYCS